MNYKVLACGFQDFHEQPRTKYIVNILKHDLNYKVYIFETVSMRNFLGFIKEFMTYITLCFSYDLVMFLQPSTSIAYMIHILVAKIMGKPVIYDLYYSPIEAEIYENKIDPSSLKGRFHRMRESFIIRLVDLVYVDTKSSQRYFSWRYKKSESEIVPLYGFVDTELFHPRVSGNVIKKKHRLRKNSPIIMYHGSFLRVHGLKYVVEAIPNVIKEFSNAIFFFVGYGQTLEETQKIALDLGIKSIIFTGEMIPHHELPKYIAVADIYLGLFSGDAKAQRTARFGMFEAMSMGKPVISAKTLETSLLFDDKNMVILVNPEDPKDISDNILSLLRDEALRRDIGKSARNFVIKDFSLTVLDSILRSTVMMKRKKRSPTVFQHVS